MKNFTYISLFIFSVFGFYTSGIASGSSEVKLLVSIWNDAHNKRDMNVFSNLYDSRVLFYGSKLVKEDCVTKKNSSLNKLNYSQTLSGEIRVQVINERKIRCSFTKNVIIGTKETEYPSYLLFEKVSQKWKILVEGDDVTDRNLNKRWSPQIPADAIKGDYNGDGVQESMWLVKPVITEDGDCIGDCSCFIQFSNPSFPRIPVSQCISGTPENHGDLNNDGSDEIGLSPGWFSSCWGVYYVWTVHQLEWKELIESFQTHCNQWDANYLPVQLDPVNPGHVVICYSEYDGEEVIIKKKSIKVR